MFPLPITSEYHHLGHAHQRPANLKAESNPKLQPLPHDLPGMQYSIQHLEMTEGVEASLSLRQACRRHRVASQSLDCKTGDENQMSPHPRAWTAKPGTKIKCPRTVRRLNRPVRSLYCCGCARILQAVSG